MSGRVEFLAGSRMTYWIEFTDGSASCMESAKGEDWKAAAEKLTGKKVSRCDVLPYPAEPQIGLKPECPAFCYSPRECRGKTCCPKNPACDN